MSEPYRSAALTVLPPPMERERDLVPFDGVCPWCGSRSRVEHHYGQYRRFVPARHWWWQFWRPPFPHFDVQCRECRAWFREMTREVCGG